MWLPTQNLEPLNNALLQLEQRLLSLYRNSLSLEEFLEGTLLNDVWALIDSNPYQALQMARVKSSHAMTPRHAINVMLIGRAWAVLKHKLGSKLSSFSLACLLHDIGHWREQSLVYVFDYFTHDQFREMQKHPLLDDEQKKCLPEEVVTWISQHHEQPNGKGYPGGLKNEAIHMLSHALRIVDCYDGLTTARRFRPRYTPKEALVLMQKWAHHRIHAGLLKSFIAFVGGYPVGSFVSLINGKRGITLPPEGGQSQVLILTNADGDSVDDGEIIQLKQADVTGESPSWHRPDLPSGWENIRPDLIDLPRAF